MPARSHRLASAALLVAGLIFCGSPARAARYGGPRGAAPDTDAIFRGEIVLEIALEVNAAGLEILRANGSNRESSPDRGEAEATVREGTNVYERVAIHLKGSAGSFRDLDRKPGFTLKFDEHVPAQRFHGLEKISLNNSVQDPTYMCEFLGRELCRAAGVPVPRAGHARVTFNGQPQGLYVLVEGWNKQFLKRHFPDVRGNLYEGTFRRDLSPGMEIKSGADPDDPSMLDALLRAAREPDLERRPDALGRVIDPQAFATFAATEVLLNHWDGYCLNVNNYRVFHDRRTDRLVFLPHGMDQLFGVRPRSFDARVLPEMNGMVAAAFLETRTGRRLYLDRLADLSTNLLDAPALLAGVEKLETLLRPALADQPGARAEFDSRVPVLRRRLEERAREVREQLNDIKSLRFNGQGEASLADRTFHNALRDAFTRRRGAVMRQFGGANTGRLFGSWQTLVELAPGRYRFEVRTRTEWEGRPVPANAVLLRSSEGRDSRLQPATAGWSVVEHQFTLEERAYVSLAFDLGAMEGYNALERSTLRLVRAGGPPPRSSIIPDAAPPGE